MNRPENQPQPDERARAAEALTLRRSGLRYDDIAGRLGYRDESGPRKAVTRLLTRIESEGVAELREIEGQRLDSMQAAVWDAAASGDLDAIRAVLTIMDRRARLFGLNMPTTVAVDAMITDREFAEQAVELIAALRPETMAEVVGSMPGIHAATMSELPEGASTREAVSPVSVALSGENDEPEPWAEVVDDVAPQRDNTSVVGVVASSDDDPVIVAEAVIEATDPEQVAEPEPVAPDTATEVGQTTTSQRRYKMPAGQVYAPPVDGFRRRLGSGGRPVTVVHNAP